MEYELIDFVKAHPILYQRQYSALRYAGPKMEKWRELGRKLKKDPNAIRHRWRGLRNHFAKKFKEKGHNEDDAIGQAPRWKYYNHIKFLSSEYENYVSSAQIENLDESGGTAVEAVEETDESADNETSDLNEYLNISDSDTKAAQKTEKTTEDDITRHSKPNHLFKDHTLNEACREMYVLLQKSKQHITPPSHNQVFFNSLALQVDQAEMMPLDQMRLQQQVLELVTHEILISQEQGTYE